MTQDGMSSKVEQHREEVESTYVRPAISQPTPYDTAAASAHTASISSPAFHQRSAVTDERSGGGDAVALTGSPRAPPAWPRVR